MQWRKSMTENSITVKKALSSQDTLLGQSEHCSIDPEQLTRIGRAIGHQVRIKRNNDEYALYTVSETRQENPDTIVRMGQDARRRLGILEEFDAILDAQVPHPTLTEAKAEANSEFIERLTDDGFHTGLIAIAPHGGMIEQFTDRQAERVAAKLVNQGVSCWRCKGWKQNGGAFERWHITSTDIHEASFPLLNTIINRGFTHAIAFHGFERNEVNNFDVLIGGGAEDALKQEIQVAIQNVIDDPNIRVIIAASGMNLGGGDRRNIVNRLAVNQNGIQIEQSKQVRQNFWQDIADAIASVFLDKSSSLPLNQVSEPANVMT
jgi:phage replication-related protein YjqB (UPF0714/DUF867 family)